MPEQRNAFIVSQRLHYQRRFYLRPKFRQLQRVLGPAYPKGASEGFALSLAHASGYQNDRGASEPVVLVL